MRSIMFQGCTSDAGKSFLVALMCRGLVNRKVDVVPFKAQNMSNNAAVTADGKEMGRAQWLQAIAAKRVPSVSMNPILLKPANDTFSQVIVNGEVNSDIGVLPWRERRQHLWPHVKAALASLSHHHTMIIEGAGSPAEVNLRNSDIVNMAVAIETNADVYIVADINRGGAYAHLLGTYMCLSEQDQSLIKGFILNRFRGDENLLAPANEWIKQKTGVPVVAVIPELSHQLPEEDQLHYQASFTGTDLNIGLISYPWASNMDEFDPLFNEPGVNLIPISSASDLSQLDALILPGSKNSGASLAYLERSGLDQLIIDFAHSGKTVLGICGGLQILGQAITDPHQIEDGDHQGLNLIPLTTELKLQKIKQQTTVATEFGFDVTGYEIHCGISQATSDDLISHTGDLGWRYNNISGTYLHNIFNNTAYRQQFLTALGWQGRCIDWDKFINKQLDTLSAHPAIEQLLDRLQQS